MWTNKLNGKKYVGSCCEGGSSIIRKIIISNIITSRIITNII